MLQLRDNIQKCPAKNISSSPNWVVVSSAPSSAGKPVVPCFFIQIP